MVCGSWLSKIDNGEATSCTASIRSEEYLARKFSFVNPTQVCDRIGTFGSRRFSVEQGGSVPPEQLNYEESVRLAFDYTDLESGLYAKKYGAVRQLAWRWGLKSCSSVRSIHAKIRFGKTIHRATYSPQIDRVLDVFSTERTLIDMVVRMKGRTSKRRLGTAFREETGMNVSDSTIYKKLKELKVEVARRRYRPWLSSQHMTARYFFGAKHLRDDFRFHVDVDEKWLVLSFFVPMFLNVLC